jgi:hypothetical protein
MFCTKCGQEVNEGTKFCTKCGTSLLVSVPVPAKQTIHQISFEQAGVNENVSILFLISAILFSIGSIVSFIFYQILYIYPSVINMVSNLASILSLIFGMIALGKIRKIIGNAAACFIIILLGIVSLTDLFYLIQNII